MTTEQTITGKYLEENRMAYGLTRKEVSAEMGVTVTTLRAIEDRRYPRPEAAERVINAINTLREKWDIEPKFGQRHYDSLGRGPAQLSKEMKQQIQYLYLFCSWSLTKIAEVMGADYRSVRAICMKIERVI